MVGVLKDLGLSVAWNDPIEAIEDPLCDMRCHGDENPKIPLQDTVVFRE